MTKAEAYAQYEFEVALFQQCGTTNVINLEEWLKIKGITIKEDKK